MKSEKPYHHPDLRALLLELALKELAEQGMGKFSIRNIALRAGVSHTAIYRHFSSKNDILSTLLLEGMKLLTQALKNAAKRPAAAAHERLAAQGRAYIAFAREYPEHIAIMFSDLGMAALQPEPHSLLEKDPTDYDAFQQLEVVVIACQQEGSLNANVASGILAMLIWSMIHGLALLLKEGVIGSMAATRSIAESEIEDLLMQGFRSFFV